MKKYLLFLVMSCSFVYAQEDKYYENIMLLSNVINHIKANYVDEKDPTELIKAAIEGILQHLDPHTAYISGDDVEKYRSITEGKAFKTGIEYEMIEGYPTVISVVAGSPAAETIIKSGDVIRLIDSINIRNKSVPDIELLLTGTENSKVKLTLYDVDSIEYTVELTRKKLPDKSVNCFYYIDPSIGYIKIDQFIRTTPKEFKEAYKKLSKQGMKRLLIDLRDNPGGLIVSAVEVSDFFIEEGKKIFTEKGRKEELNHEFLSTDDDLSTEIPIVILINRGSASASELVAAALQDNDRALLVGTNSFGKGLGMNYFYLKSGGLLVMTCLRGETPTGRSVQRKYKEKSFKEYRHEIYNTDSINYKNLPTAKTLGGRTIYTGSGVLPDIFIDFNNKPPIKGWTKILIKDLLKSFCENYYKSNILFFDKIRDFYYYCNKFEVDDKAVEELIIEFEKIDIKINKENNDINKFLKRTLKSEIAKLKWDSSQVSLFNILTDPQVVKAIESFNNINALLKTNS